MHKSRHSVAILAHTPTYDRNRCFIAYIFLYALFVETFIQGNYVPLIEIQDDYETEGKRKRRKKEGRNRKGGKEELK
jgi:hypothetical protein